jgi:hypothetical protein
MDTGNIAAGTAVGVGAPLAVYGTTKGIAIGVKSVWVRDGQVAVDSVRARLNAQADLAKGPLGAVRAYAELRASNRAWFDNVAQGIEKSKVVAATATNPLRLGLIGGIAVLAGAVYLGIHNSDR